MNMNTQLTEKAAIQNPMQIRDIFAQSGVKRSAMLKLAENGVIIDANFEAEELLTISSGQTRKLHISRIVSALRKIDLLDSNKKRVNAYLRFLSRIGHKFKLRSLSGTEFFGELFFSDIESANQHIIVVKIQPV
jgi:hypothetical protein